MDQVREERRLALMMALHERLGADTGWLQYIPDHILHKTMPPRKLGHRQVAGTLSQFYH